MHDTVRWTAQALVQQWADERNIRRYSVRIFTLGEHGYAVHVLPDGMSRSRHVISMPYSLND